VPPGRAEKGLSTAQSFHAGGRNVLLTDGSMRLLRETVPLDVGRSLGTRAGGEIPGES
jgi:hypothetical protein